jgi:hypothetical protein
MALTKITNGMSGASAADLIFNNDAQSPVMWETGAYTQNRTVLHKPTGRIYYAAVDITTPTVEPGSNANWVELLTGYTKAEKLGFLLNNPATVVLDQTAATLTFTGTTNIVVGQRNRYLITAATLDLTTVSGEFVILAMNRTTGAVAMYTSSNVAGIPDTHIIFGGVRKGTGKWLLTNISNYTYLPAPVPINNKFFEPGTVSLAESINNALLSMEWYDILDTEFISFYGIGKQYQFNSTEKRDYMGFRLGATTTPVVNTELGPVEWGGSFYQANAEVPTGIKTYTFRRTNGALLGKVTINWDLIATGYRLIQTTSAASNDKVLRYTFKASATTAMKRTNAIIADIELDKYYDTLTTADYSNASGTSVPVGLGNVSNFYALWDAFVSANPGYATRTLLTDQVPTETTPLSMYAYTFDPPITRNDDTTVSNPVFKPTIFINTAMHGFEKTGALCNYELIKQMLTNWQSDPFLEYLRWNVKIIVIPSANPWGWNTGGGTGARKNYRGVDLNRNFPVGWAAAGVPTDPTYPGPSALSEVESQAIYTFTNSIQGGFIGLDFHNFHGSVQEDPKNYNTAWLEAASNFMIDIGYATSRVTTRKFRTKTETLPTDPNWLAMTTSLGLGAGKLSAHLNNINMYSGTFEVAQNFRFAEGFKPHDANAIKFGTESWGNFLRLAIKNALLDYNIKH